MAGPRLVQVEVPKDRTLRNMFLGSVLAAIVLGGLAVGGYLLVHRLSGARGRTAEPEPSTPSPGSVVEPQQEPEPVEPAETPEASEPALPELTGIFPDPIQPIALLNGRRLKLGGNIRAHDKTGIQYLSKH